MTTSAPGSESPDSRNTVPPTTAYGSSAFCFLSACNVPASTSARRRPLFPILLILFFLLLLLFILVVIEVLVFVVAFLLFIGGLKLQRVETDHSQIGTTFVARERFAFVQFVLVHVNYSIATRAVDHFSSLPSTNVPNKNLKKRTSMPSPPSGVGASRPKQGPSN